MEIKIRQERKDDYHDVEVVVREAFWGCFEPVCNEHYLVHLLRDCDAFIPELDLVAEIEGRIVGHIVYSKAKVVDENGKEYEVLTFGPLSVLPEYQKCGVGASLIKYSVLEAKKLGYNAIVIYGHPDYYARFGFRSARTFGIGAPFDANMALELYDGALRGIKGKFIEDPVFEASGEAAAEYDKLFEPKEPAEMTSIDVLLERIPESAGNYFKAKGFRKLNFINRVSGRELLAWDGIDEDVLHKINEVLREYGIAEKLFPGCEILERAKAGINALINM